MISVMDMTTGIFERDDFAKGVRFASVGASLREDGCRADLPLYAGLNEYVTVSPRYGAMPVELANQDVDIFLARMAHPAAW